ncbi:MAG: PACE efflux transporter [Curvibacter sp.]|nr:PACE efflux transporter [Curvibacter sp.]
MQGWRRRLLYVSVFEGLAIVCTSHGLAHMAGDGLGHAAVMGAASSLIAVLWNLIFNGLFERWERRQSVKGRSVARRIAHACGFEGGLLLIFVPLFAWWFGVSLWTSFLMDLGLLLFFLVYTFAYNWLFDRLFGLPASAC